MVHPITKTLQPIDPPLEPGEKLEVYFAADHDLTPPRRHAFGIVIDRSSGHPPIEISPAASLSPDTHSQRGNLGAVITVFEWLERNQAQGHDVTIYSKEPYILDLEASSRSKGTKVKDLYDLIVPKLKDWPRVHFLSSPTYDHTSPGVIVLCNSPERHCSRGFHRSSKNKQSHHLPSNGHEPYETSPSTPQPSAKSAKPADGRSAIEVRNGSMEPGRFPGGRISGIRYLFHPHPRQL
jgi:hypothetical protein